jgi:hypothetical protein
VNFAAITLCIVSQRVFIFVDLYYVIDSVRKLLDTPSYFRLLLRETKRLQPYVQATRHTAVSDKLQHHGCSK